MVLWHPSAAVIRDVTSLIRQGGPEICCLLLLYLTRSLLWTSSSGLSSSQAWRQSHGQAGSQKLLGSGPASLCISELSTLPFSSRKPRGKIPHLQPFKHRVREQLEGSGRKSAIKGTCLHPYGNINGLTKTTHLDFSVATIKPLENPLGLGERAVFIHKW